MSAIVRAGGSKVIVSVNRQNFKTVIAQTLATQQVLADKDIGEFVGSPVPDYVRGKQHTIKLTIQFYNFTSPPYKKRNGQNFVRAIYNIPDVDRSKLDWVTIKLACGGANGYMWGRFRATATLDNGRQMQVLGGTEDSAITRLKALANLSTAKIQTLSCSEEKREGRRKEGSRMAKRSVRIYPAYFSIINFQKVELEENREYSGVNSTFRGDFIRSKVPKIPLWVASEPKNTKLLIQEALRVRAARVTQ